MVRLFIAIDIPQDIRILICGMGASIPGARPVPTEQLHLTLKFLGDTPREELPDIMESLAAIHHSPFNICLNTVGHFPPRGTPKVLWTGVAPAQDVISLRNRIESTLSGIGIERDRRKFAPHVTLARLRNSPLKRVTQFLAGNSLFVTPDFTVREFHLYSSTLTPKGAVHTLLASYPLHTT